MYYMTNGALYFYVDQISTNWCIVWRMFIHISEGMLGWTLVLFNVERLVALQWPFFMRSFVTPRRVLLELCVLFFLCILLAQLAIPAYQLVPGKVIVLTPFEYCIVNYYTLLVLLCVFRRVRLA